MSIVVGTAKEERTGMVFMSVSVNNLGNNACTLLIKISGILMSTCANLPWATYHEGA
jgi:hypothetical protein